MPGKSLLNRLPHRALPFLRWRDGYSAAAFGGDLLAGLTVAVVLIPQAMAYAMLAGLPPVYGLYAGAVTPMIAALWGSLRQLATGPIAIMSLLVLTTLTPFAEPGSEQFIRLAVLLSLLVGCIYLLVGVFRMGQVMTFISHSAVRGFTAAAALIIIATQLPNFLGIPVSRHEFILPMLVEIAHSLPQMHWPTTMIGIFSFAVIYGLKRYRPHVPAGLLALVLATLAIWLFELHETGVAVIGKVPEGLPGYRLPLLEFDIISALLGPAVVIALVSFAETYSVSKSISSATRQKTDVNQEFIGQGVANLVGSLFQCYPVSGSFSRTAINYAAGARTGVSSVVTSLLVIVSLLYLTPLFTLIPKAALAALVISAVLILFHPKQVFVLWRQNRTDGLVAITVFVLALLAKPDYALLIGVMISLMLFLWKTMHPRIVRETRDPERGIFLNADLHRKPGCPQILHLRSDNVIYFANAEYTVNHIMGLVNEVDGPLKFVLLDFQAISFIDMTGIEELRSLKAELEERGIRLALMAIHRPVMDTFERSGFIHELEDSCYFEKGWDNEHRGDAIAKLFPEIDHDYCRNVCPHSLFEQCESVKLPLSAKEIPT
jgi:SulP family sulfate permease